eukprot:scaffold1084_cov76-Skeletonema_dohrnii-CCMP3373.AAC.2
MESLYPCCLPFLVLELEISRDQGGASMLGLGDIVLPGLLLSFASRFDEANRLMGLLSGGAGRVPTSHPGTFVVVADMVDTLARSLWPALLDWPWRMLLCTSCRWVNLHCCIWCPAALGLGTGTFVFIALRNGELNDIWDNPCAIRAADALLFRGRIEAEDEDDARASSLLMLMNEGAEMT